LSGTKGEGLNPGGRGRKTPVAVREMQGNPGHNKMPEVVTVVGRLSRPDHVDGYAAEVWDRITGAMPVGVFTPTDSDALAAYCVACATMRDTTIRLAIEGEVLYGRGGETSKVNPWFNVQTKARGQIITLGAQLGLTPIARENIPAPKAAVGDGKWSGLVDVIEGGKKG